MTLEEAMDEIFNHGFLFTLRPKKGLEALRVIRKVLRDYREQQHELSELRDRLHRECQVNDMLRRSNGEQHAEICKLEQQYRKVAGDLNKELSKKEAWIPCSERMPEEGKTVLVAYENWDGELVQCVSERFQISGMEKWSSLCGQTAKYWMPLPEPPKGVNHQ